MPLAGRSRNSTTTLNSCRPARRRSRVPNRTQGPGTARGGHTRSSSGTSRAIARFLSAFTDPGFKPRSMAERKELGIPAAAANGRAVIAAMRAPDAHGVLPFDNSAHDLRRRPGVVGVVEDALDGGDVGGVFMGGHAQALVLVAGDHDVVLAGEGQGLRRGGHR